MSNSGVILIFATGRLLHSWTLYCIGYKTATPLTIQLLSYCTYKVSVSNNMAPENHSPKKNGTVNNM